MKLTHEASGTFAIAPTPFHPDGRIDDKSIDSLVDFYDSVGCDGVTVLGILGEAPKLDSAEAEEVAKRFVKRAKKMQIIVGVSSPSFATMRSLARASMDAGAAAVMIAPPPHLRTDDQITTYFKQAQAVSSRTSRVGSLSSGRNEAASCGAAARTCAAAERTIGSASRVAVRAVSRILGLVVA